MYAFLSELLSDKTGGITFSCFGLWHLCYLFVAVLAIVFTVIYIKNKDGKTKQKAMAFFINCAFGLYMADFFLMPFAYGKIDIEKLPFHVCTAMCVMCFWSRHNSFLGRYKLQFAMLGFISNLVYMIYPAGLMWYQVHPLSYRVIQTLLFHALMTAYGLMVLLFGSERFEWKRCYKDLIVIVCMVLWALLGNTLYNGTAWGQTCFYNWFFVVRDPFYMLPEHVAPFIMPFVNIIVFFAVEMVVYAVLRTIRKKLVRRIGTTVNEKAN